MTTNAQKYTAELLGTLIVVFVGTAAIVVSTANPTFAPMAPLVAALAFGIAWAGMWWVFGNVSGGHFNPAITIASAVAKRMNGKDVVPYIIVQAIGGIIGAALLWGVLRGAPTAVMDGAAASSLAAVTVGGWTTTSILLLELLLVAFLCLVWLAATEKTGAVGITGLGIGVGYAGLLLASIGLTWSALNPVRTLGPVLLAKTGGSVLWVFWVAAIVGAIVGAGIWMAVVQPARAAAPVRYTAEA